ncbi:hypothetical protein [Sphingomonas sp. VDB2]|uniref:hypothetical protein n=1 Tax=Sphingomonas sp. VDB2 TaxID=3228751 RepID=UPI003A805604
MACSLDPEAPAGEVLRLGTIASVDPPMRRAPCAAATSSPATCLESPSAPAGCAAGEGGQCLLLAPEGDLANGLVIVGLYSNVYPPPSTYPNVNLIQYDDDAVIG